MRDDENPKHGSFQTQQNWQLLSLGVGSTSAINSPSVGLLPVETWKASLLNSDPFPGTLDFQSLLGLLFVKLH
ncbi:unnamed protein product [Sphenostylis stenocarpa]|uniref:Uncharacterized protein n=1 Tax=Sphenostylis stenocarpa TaxID=92480 RepID=A0AA86SWN5_9FABA|nr:unnamed protein product [Sphenostylis stenocarpa]